MPIRDRPASTNDSVSADNIALVEARIEELAEAIERCRKISLAAKIAAAAGTLWIALTLLGIVEFAPALAVAALAAMIGGVVLLGSNATTWTQTQSAMRASEALRADIIGRLELRPVNDNGGGFTRAIPVSLYPFALDSRPGLQLRRPELEALLGLARVDQRH